MANDRIQISGLSAQTSALDTDYLVLHRTNTQNGNVDYKITVENFNESSTTTAAAPIVAELKGQEARLAAIRAAQDKKKYDEITQEEKDQKAEAEKAVQEQKDKKTAVIADYAKGNSIVHQLIDLALWNLGTIVSSLTVLALEARSAVTPAGGATTREIHLSVAAALPSDCSRAAPFCASRPLLHTQLKRS